MNVLGPRGGPVARAAWDLGDPAGRRRASLNYHLSDHAILRYHWTNTDLVAPGVWRSNQPTHGRLAALKAMGIRSILNLRGAGQSAAHLFEAESCRALGLTLVSVSLRARLAPERDAVLALFEAFRTIERPFLMHCKSGADRAGLASALYVLAQGGTVAQARKHLSFRYLHVRASRTGVLDHILDLYEAAHAATGIGVEAWFAAEYDARAADAGFDALHRARFGAGLGTGLATRLGARFEE